MTFLAMASSTGERASARERTPSLNRNQQPARAHPFQMIPGQEEVESPETSFDISPEEVTPLGNNQPLVLR